MYNPEMVPAAMATAPSTGGDPSHCRGSQRGGEEGKPDDRQRGVQGDQSLVDEPTRPVGLNDLEPLADVLGLVETRSVDHC